MTDSAAPAANGPIPVAELVQADPHDFVPDAELFIRGRPAVCIRFDYPHVYWRFTDDDAILESLGRLEPIEKHRSYSCTPEIFKVLASKKRSAPIPHGDNDDYDAHLQHAIRDGSAFKDEDDHAPIELDEEPSHAASTTDASASSSSTATSSSETPSSDDETPAQKLSPSRAMRASLMSMFARRPEKAVFRDVHDRADEHVTARAPQSVSIESSQRAKFRIPSKINQLTLLNCEDVEVEFLGAISSVELIHCRRCTLRNTSICETYTLDDAEACTIQFPGFQSRVMFVNTSSHGTTLVAIPGGSAPVTQEDETPFQLNEEVRFTVEEQRGDGPEIVSASLPQPLEPDAEPLSPTPTASAAPKQYRTVYSRGVFTTELLERSGLVGYFANNV